MLLLVGLTVVPTWAQNQNYSQYEGAAPVVYITENIYEQPDIIAIFNNTHSGYFRDPKASRFILVDQKGRWGLGIGGYVQTKAEYDFGGIVDNVDFLPSYVSTGDQASSRFQMDATLHGGGGKGRRGVLLTGGALDRVYGEGLTLHSMHHLHSGGFVGEADLSLMVAVEAGGKGLLIGCDQGRVNGPVFLGLEGADLILAIHEDLGSHRLHTSRGQTAPHRLPQEGRELIAHDTVKDTAGLLSVDQVHIDGTGLLDGGLDHRLGDLVEGHALNLLHGNTESGCQVPGNGLSLAIRVGCEENFVRVLGFLLDFLDDVALAADVDIVGGEIVFDIHTQGALGQVADVTYRSDYLVVGSEVALDGARLGGRLHNDQIRFCHGILYFLS